MDALSKRLSALLVLLVLTGKYATLDSLVNGGCDSWCMSVTGRASVILYSRFP